MSTGDLLFIFAFIVLPTIILVSCIWTLLLIRAGVLLPERRHIQPAAETTSAELSDDVIVNTAVETAIVAAPTAAVVAVEPEPEVAPVVAAEEPVVEAPVADPEPVLVSEIVEDAETEPPTDDVADERFEKTTDFPVITDAMLAEADEHEQVGAEDDVVVVSQPEPVAEPPTMPMPAPVAEQLATPPAVEASQPDPAPELDVLFVPLPDDEPADDFADVAADAPAADDAAADDEQDGESGGTREGRSRRKPVRRVAQLRPSEEQANSISPMGSLLRRSRSGSSR